MKPPLVWVSVLRPEEERSGVRCDAVVTTSAVSGVEPWAPGRKGRCPRGCPAPRAVPVNPPAGSTLGRTWCQVCRKHSLPGTLLGKTPASAGQQASVCSSSHEALWRAVPPRAQGHGRLGRIHGLPGARATFRVSALGEVSDCSRLTAFLGGQFPAVIQMKAWPLLNPSLAGWRSVHF